MAAAISEVERLLKEYRHALSDGLAGDKERYTLISMSQLNGLSHPGVAYSVHDYRLYVLVDNSSDNHHPENVPLFLLDTAKELTQAFRTFVVPDQTSVRKTMWGGKKSGPIIAYRFKLADSPISLHLTEM